MTDCKHETAIILHTTPAYEIAMCTWGCGQHLVSVTDPDTRLTRTWTVAELVAAKTRRRARGGNGFTPFIDDSV